MKGLSPDEARDLILSVGTHKATRRLTPVQVAEKIQKSVDAGDSIDNICQEINLSKNVIRSFLSILKLPEKVKAIIGWGTDPTTIAFSSGVEIARLGTENDQEILANAVLENELSLKDVTQAVQIRHRSGGTIKESVQAVLNQRPIIEKRHLIIGEVIPSVTQQLLSFDQIKRNELFTNALRNFGPGKPIHGSKLNERFFIIVCDDHYFQALGSMGKDIESVISNLLEKELNNN